MKRSSPNSQAAFTLADAMVACGLAALVGFIGYAILNTSTILYAKVTSINLAHDESRIAVNRLVGDIHKAVSTPQLWDGKANGANGLIDFTEHPVHKDKINASCVSFQIVPPDGGPYEVKNDPGNPDLIMIGASKNGFQATVGMRLIIPMYNIENTIIKATSNGSDHFNVWMANGEERIPKTKKDTKVICYYTVRNFYAVEDGELRAYLSGQNGNGIISTSVDKKKLLFKNSDGTAAKWVTIARNITSDNPFNVPNYPDRRYVGVDLTTEDSTYSKRGFKATNTLIAGSIPFRARLCEVQ
jgi:hypothetical protein